MPIRIACIVEGHGDVAAVPILVRRIVSEINPTVAVEMPLPIRIFRSKISTAGELEKAVELAVRKVGRGGAVLVLIDSDDDCPATLAPQLLARSKRAEFPASVVLAKREFDAWFLAAAESLRGVKGLPQDLEAPADPEQIQGAKEWLGTRMPTRRYSERIDQPGFAARFSLRDARRAASFDKCYREVERLVGLLASS